MDQPKLSLIEISTKAHCSISTMKFTKRFARNSSSGGESSSSAGEGISAAPQDQQDPMEKNGNGSTSTTATNGPQLLLTTLREQRSGNSNSSKSMKPRPTVNKINFYPAEVEQLRAQFHNQQTANPMVGVLSSFIAPLAAESSASRHSAPSSKMSSSGLRNEEAMQKFRFNDRDLSALLSDEKSFLALQLSLRRKGAVTNALLLQGLPFFIMKNRKLLMERVERDEKRRQEAQEQKQLEEEAQRLRQEAGIMVSEHDIAAHPHVKETLELKTNEKKESVSEQQQQQRIPSQQLGNWDELESRWAQRDASRSSVSTATSTNSS